MGRCGGVMNTLYVLDEISRGRQKLMGSRNPALAKPAGLRTRKIDGILAACCFGIRRTKNPKHKYE